MKSQLHRAIKAHLLRAAFYPLLFLAVFTFPSALAQRNGAKKSAAKQQSASEFPTTSNAAAAPGIGVFVIAPIPAAPAIILYDQMNNPAPTPTPPLPGGVTSQDFEPEFDNYDSFAADDFVVPAGQIWNISEVDVIGESSEPPVPPDSFHVFFYADSGTLPGTLVAGRLANSYSGFGEFVITLTNPVMLAEGTYWVSVQARKDFTSSGQWFWDNRLVISNSGAAWQKPGRRVWDRLFYLGPQDYLPSNPKWAGPTIPPGRDTRNWNPDAAATPENYTNAQDTSDPGATPLVRRHIGTTMAFT